MGGAAEGFAGGVEVQGEEGEGLEVHGRWWLEGMGGSRSVDVQMLLWEAGGEACGLCTPDGGAVRKMKMLCPKVGHLEISV